MHESQERDCHRLHPSFQSHHTKAASLSSLRKDHSIRWYILYHGNPGGIVEELTNQALHYRGSVRCSEPRPASSAYPILQLTCSAKRSNGFQCTVNCALTSRNELRTYPLELAHRVYTREGKPIAEPEAKPRRGLWRTQNQLSL